MRKLRAAISIIGIILLAGCGGGGGRLPVTTGSLEGYVYVAAGTRSGSDATCFVASDRSGAPSGYEPLASANIEATVGGNTLSTTTDASGHFLIQKVPAGKVDVRIIPPAGSIYRDFTTSIDVTAGRKASMGQDGNVSLIGRDSTVLNVAVNSIDISAWPTVSIYVSVNDPQTGTGVLGLKPLDFHVLLNDAAVSSLTVRPDVTAGTNPRQIYVLSTTMAGNAPGYLRAEVQAAFSGKSGSASGSTGQINTFCDAVSGTVSYGFKAPNYTNLYPGKWHTGADITAVADTRVNSVARGEVALVLISGEDTGVVVKHRLAADFTTVPGKTRDIYVLYGCINPIVGAGAVVEPGEQLGTIRAHSDGAHLHLGLRVGETITSAWGMASLENGLIPAADSYGLTDGWVDPILFMKNRQPDNTWEP